MSTIHGTCREGFADVRGLPGRDEPMTVADVMDREKATALLARQAPGSVPGHESITMGPLLGEIVRRTGRSLTEFFADEIAGPLGADRHIGAPHRARPRLRGGAERGARCRLLERRAEQPNVTRAFAVHARCPAGSTPAAVLVRPDGYVAWAGEGGPELADRARSAVARHCGRVDAPAG